jgi:hypothetical protein
MPRGVNRYDEARLQRRLWSPATLRPFGWWDASNLSSISTVAGRVNEWRDISGNGYVFSQATDANRPTLNVNNGLNGLPVLDFASSFMQITSTRTPWRFLHTAQSTVVFVGKFGVLSNPNDIYVVLCNNALVSALTGYALTYDDRTASSRNDSIVQFITRGQTGNFVTFNVVQNVITPNVPTIVTSLQDAVASPVSQRSIPFINGVEFAKNNTSTGVANNADSSYDLQLGADGNSANAFDGYMAEILIFNRLLTTKERGDLEMSLSWKWGIQNIFPAQNQFINRPPLIGD